MEEKKPDLLDQLISKQVNQQATWTKILDRIISRKLAVWVVSTYLLLQKVITVDEWKMITMMFIGAEGASNIVDSIKQKLIK